METTNEELGFPSHDPGDLISRGCPHPHPVNPYQTHIVNLKDDAYNYTLGATSDKCKLVRLPSEEYDYENCVANFGEYSSI